MKRTPRVALAVLVLPVTAAAMLVMSEATRAAEKRLDASHQWGQWRGPRATGVAPHGDPPIRWSENNNVRWKTALPGKGLSSPIIWGDRIYLTTAIPHGGAEPVTSAHVDGAHNNVEPTRRHRFEVLAVDRRDGTVVWRKAVQDARPHEATHETGSWASASAVTDGERVFAFFGSQGLYALDTDGNLLWKTDLGDMQVRHAHGEGSTPALHGDTLVVNWDHQGDSFVVALDARTGKERWKVPRDEFTSWSSPLVVEHEGRAQVVIAATNRVRGYDVATGKVIWEVAGLSRNVVATPVAAEGLVFVANSYDWQAMLAIRLAGARGDITDTDNVVWKLERHTPYVPSPVLYGGRLFFIKHLQGLMSAVDAASGKVLWGPERLPGMHSVFASPVAAADRIYVVSREGAGVVLRRAATLKVLAENSLDDSFSASPAIVGDALYLRGEQHLYCIATGVSSR